MRRCDRGQQHTNMSNVKGLTENGSPLSHPAPGPFYYSGRVGPRHRLPRGSRSGPGPMGFVVKWFIFYPSVVIFGAGLAIMFAPFYGLVWGGPSFAAEPSEVPAGRSVFPCSVACLAASGSELCLEAVRFRSGPAGASGCRGWTVRFGSVCVSCPPPSLP